MPPLIGLNFSSCSTCKEALIVTFLGQQTHPTCESTQEEQQARQFVDAVQRGDEPQIAELERLLNLPALPKLGASALWYAKQGWPVFPLLPNQKVPATRNGFKDATTDLSKVKAWWHQHPEANIGLPSGVMWDVIDIDGPTGIASMHDLGDDVLPDIHGKVNTPKGLHLYVLPTGDGNRAGVKPGIDYRGQGGYVVAPPSQIGLKRYAWIMKPSPAILQGAG